VVLGRTSVIVLREDIQLMGRGRSHPVPPRRGIDCRAMNLTRRLFMLFSLSALALGLMAAPALASPKAYALNYATNSVAVIDTQTNQVVNSIPVGEGPYNIAVTPDGKTAYAVNESEHTISVIDLQSEKTIGNPIELGGAPDVVAISPDGKTAYVTTSAGSVSVIDTQTNQVVGTIPVGEGESSIWGVAFSPDGKTAYVTNYETNTVEVIDTATRQVVGAPIPVGEEPINIALTPDGTKAYVVDEESNAVSVINTQTRQVITTIPVGNEPWGIAITPDGKKAYVVNFGSETVSVINTQTNQVVGAPVPVGSEPYEVAITPDGKSAYVANYGTTSESLTVIDTQTDTVKTTVPDPGGRPWQIVVAPDKSPLPTFVTTQSKSGGPVAFNGAGSLDPDGTVTSFAWTFGDGKSALGGSTVKHKYAKGGKYTAGLAVTDNEGCSVSQVFTGRTAYCSGSAAASRAIKVLPSNQFRFGKLTKNRRNGTAKLQVVLPAAGALELTGKKVRFVNKRAAKKGKVTLVIRPKAKANKALKRSHHLKARIRVTFSPTGGNARSKGKALTLIRNK
jgi:YVTN family beta-propeller protein